MGQLTVRRNAGFSLSPVLAFQLAPLFLILTSQLVVLILIWVFCLSPKKLVNARARPLNWIFTHLTLWPENKSRFVIFCKSFLTLLCIRLYLSVGQVQSYVSKVFDKQWCVLSSTIKKYLSIFLQTTWLPIAYFTNCPFPCRYKTSSQSSVDAIDAELQTAELLRLLILLEE